MGEPLVTVATDGSRRIVGAADAVALALGLKPADAIAHAQAMVPKLNVADATPEEDAAGLMRLALWCLRYAPIVAADPPDGIFIDIAGAAHLLGGEDRLIADLVSRLSAKGIAARAAVADCPGAAWAVARYGNDRVVAPGRTVETVAILPVEALRLSPDTLDALDRLGIERVGQLAAMPRAPMTRRFGKDVALRLDQAFGHAFEPISPLVPQETPSRRLVFPDPIGHLDDLNRVVLRLANDLCGDLFRRGLGARRLDLIFRRVDRKDQALRVGTARATRDAVHLAKLFDEMLGTIDPGFGIDEARLIASRVEALSETQGEAAGIGLADDAPDIAPSSTGSWRVSDQERSTGSLRSRAMCPSGRRSASPRLRRPAV